MKILYTTELSLQVEDWESLESHDHQTNVEFLQETLQKAGYNHLPTFAKLYPSPYRISEATEIKLETVNDLNQLNALPQSTILVLTMFPAEPATILLVVSIVLTVATYFLIPDVPDAVAVDTASTSSASPNTELAARSNKPRIKGRIPDILGQVYSIPDMLMPAYTVYVDNQEVELAYMCIGRHRYLVEEIRDETTLISDIEGASAEVYTAYESKWQGHSPEVLIGNVIPDPIRAVQRVSSVNGQTLEFVTPSAGGTVRLFFTLNKGEAGVPNGTYGIAIHAAAASGVPTIHFKVGDTISVQTRSAGAVVVNVISLTAYTAWVITPDLAYKGYATFSAAIPLTDWGNGVYDNMLVTVTASSANPSDAWHTLTQNVTSLSNPRGVLCNFSASNGLYRASNATVIPTSHTITIEVRSQATGDIQTTNATMIGDGNNSVGLTVFITPTADLPVDVKAYISASEDASDASTSHNTIKWKDLYLYEEVTTPDQRSVTTIYTRTPATEGALSVKKRKLNCIATSRFPSWTGAAFTPEVYPTTNLIDCFAAVSLDLYIGNLSVDKLDVSALYSERQNAINYFGAGSVGSIAITLDNVDMSYEETAVVLSQAMFCEVYRRGGLIRFFLEREKDSPAYLPTLLLASDNTLPASMKFSTTLGYEYEGTSIEYIDQTTGDTEALYTPTENLRLYKKLDFKGLNSDQAYWHAWRAWNKIQHSFLSFECDATEEVGLLRRLDKVYVADTTSLTVNEGVVVEQVGFTLTLSNKVTVPVGSIFLQMSDLLLQSISYTQTSDYEILLSEAPRLPLSLDRNNAVQTIYSLSAVDLDQTFREFLIEEKSGSSLYQWGLKGVNYDSRYYTQDGVLSIPPTLTLLGVNPQVLQEGDAYAEAGATAVDQYGTPLTVVIDATGVNIGVAGSYRVLYSATDGAGATTIVPRLILVEGTITQFDPPVVVLIGSDAISLPQYEAYVELGATATDNQGNVLVVTIAATVDTATPTIQVVLYIAEDSYGRAGTAARLIDVVELPTITILGDNPINVGEGTVYIDQGATAVDRGSVPLTVTTTTPAIDTNILGDQIVSYYTVEQYGAENTATRAVEVQPKPVIVLLGGSPVEIYINGVYTEVGAIAVDWDLQPLSVIISGSVDETTTGAYTLTYTATDLLGGYAEIERVVNVLPTPSWIPIFI